MFVSAYSVTTGLKQRIPEHWLSDPRIGPQFRKTPLARSRETQTSSPFDAYTVERLQEYAAEHDVDVTGITRKADLVAAITTHQAALDAKKE